MRKQIGGMDVSYTECGNGPFVFLFHGWGAPLSVYQSTIQLLSQKYTVIAPEFPGFGGTPEPETVWGMDEYAGFARDFVASFRADRVILYGHSFGGRVILKLTAMPDLPFTIDRILLVDSAGILPKKSFGTKCRIRAYKAGKAFLSLALMRKLFPDALPSLQNRSGSADYRAASPRMRQNFTKIVNEDLTGLLPGVSAPTLLIWGERDDATPLSDAKLMEAKIPDAGLVVLEGAGHYSFLDQPYVYSRVLCSFLSIPEGAE